MIIYKCDRCETIMEDGYFKARINDTTLELCATCNDDLLRVIVFREPIRKEKVKEKKEKENETESET